MTKTPLPMRQDVLYNSREHARHTLFSGTKVVQTRFYNDEKVFRSIDFYDRIFYSSIAFIHSFFFQSEMKHRSITELIKFNFNDTNQWRLWNRSILSFWFNLIQFDSIFRIDWVLSFWFISSSKSHTEKRYLKFVWWRNQKVLFFLTFR